MTSICSILGNTFINKDNINDFVNYIRDMQNINIIIIDHIPDKDIDHIKNTVENYKIVRNNSLSFMRKKIIVLHDKTISNIKILPVRFFSKFDIMYDHLWIQFTANNRCILLGSTSFIIDNNFDTRHLVEYKCFVNNVIKDHEYVIINSIMPSFISYISFIDEIKYFSNCFEKIQIENSFGCQNELCSYEYNKYKSYISNITKYKERLENSKSETPKIIFNGNSNYHTRDTGFYYKNIKSINNSGNNEVQQEFYKLINNVEKENIYTLLGTFLLSPSLCNNYSSEIIHDKDYETTMKLSNKYKNFIEKKKIVCVNIR